MVGAPLGVLPGLARRCWCFSRGAWLHGQARAACFLVAQACSSTGSCPRGARQGRLPLRPTAALSHRRHVRRLHAAALVEDTAELHAYDERYMAIALEEARQVCVVWRLCYHGDLHADSLEPSRGAGSFLTHESHNLPGGSGGRGAGGCGAGG